MDKETIAAVMSAFGKMGGVVKSEAKAEAARRNGAKGGRPPLKKKKRPAS
jgi:hypothetical protein